MLKRRSSHIRVIPCWRPDKRSLPNVLVGLVMCRADLNRGRSSTHCVWCAETSPTLTLEMHVARSISRTPRWIWADRSDLYR